MSYTQAPWVARKGDTFNPNRPWGVVRLFSKEECEEVDGTDELFGVRSEIIAEVCSATSEGIEEEDARLMAAAPEMYEALSNVRDSGAFECCCGETPCCGTCISALVEKALKKVEDK